MPTVIVTLVVSTVDHVDCMVKGYNRYTRRSGPPKNVRSARSPSLCRHIRYILEQSASTVVLRDSFLNLPTESRFDDEFPANITEVAADDG